MRIMVVDNDLVYLGLLTEVLRLHGYEVTSRHDGVEALAALREQPVDLIISDISMPRMNGLTLYRHVRQESQFKNTLFVWNSGYRELQDAAEVEDPRLDFRLDKSIPVSDLLSKLRFFDEHLRGTIRKPRYYSTA